MVFLKVLPELLKAEVALKQELVLMEWHGFWSWRRRHALSLGHRPDGGLHKSLPYRSQYGDGTGLVGGDPVDAENISDNYG